jgi:hypothetical protein
VAGGQTNACLPPFFVLDFGGMSNRYYKQVKPDTPLYLSNGQHLVFPTTDGVTGYLVTNDDFLVGEINTAINKCKGGVAVCSKEEYKEYLKKKSSGLVPEKKWREEIKAGTSSDPSKPPRFEDVLPAASPESGSKPEADVPEVAEKRVGKFRKKDK